MADTNTVVHIGENSPEQVVVDRKWLLDTYAECLRTVRQPWDRT
jgi:hypothetical protein